MDINTELRKKVASLESKLDFIETEFQHLNKLLIDCGFPEGIESLKGTIEELLSEGLDQIQDFPPTAEI